MYTDGACKGNPGIGGWGVYVLGRNDEIDLNGFDLNTTNNKMELTAVIKALEYLTEPHQIVLTTDSKYVIGGINDWMDNWKKRGWRNAKGEPVKNKELWLQLDQLVSKHKIEWQWVKGHSGDIGNETADMLANRGIDEL